MKHLLFLILSLFASVAYSQADTIFVIGADFDSYSTVNDTIYEVDCIHPVDDLGQGFNGNGIRKGYFALDVLGNLFRVDSIVAQSGGSSTLWLTEQQNAIGPVGNGIIFRSPDSTDLIPIIPFDNISYATIAKIFNHNVVNGGSGSGSGGGGTVNAVVAGDNVSVDNTDPANPIVSVPSIPQEDVTIADPGGYFFASDLQGMIQENGLSIFGIEQTTTATEQALGIGPLDTNMGSYAGSTLSDGSTQVSLNQQIENALEVKMDSFTLVMAADTSYYVFTQYNTSSGAFQVDTLWQRAVSGGGGVTIPVDEIAFGSGTGITSSSDLIRITGGIQAGSTKIAEGAGSNSIVHGNTSAASTSIGWIAQGHLAANDATTAFNFVAQGASAARSNTSGGNFVAQGYSAGYSSTTGSDWVAQGAAAGYSNTVGNRWVAQGFNAGYSNTTGSSWVAQGNEAASSSTTGQFFVAQGAQAAFNALNANSWVAQGYRAAYSHTSSYGWVATGRDAAYGNTSGDRWTAVGYESAWKLTDGTTNANFSRGVYIGAQTRVGAQNAVNEIVIGYAAYGNGSNTVTIGNSSIESNYLQNRLRIGGANSSIWLTPHDNTLVNTEGLLFADDSENRLKYYDGTTLQQLAFVSDITGGGTMSSFNIESDDFTLRSIGDGDDVSLLGENGIISRDGVVPGEVFYGLDLESIPNSVTLDGDESFLFFDELDALESKTDIDLIKGYINTGVVSVGTSTANRPLMWPSSGSAAESFPMEVTGSTTRFTQQTSVQIPTGATAFAGAPADGSMRYDSDTDEFKLRINGAYETAATEDYVDTAVENAEPDVVYTEDTDLAIFPNKMVEFVTLNTTSSAVSNTNLSLPTAGLTYAGVQIIIWSLDSSGSFSNTVSASTIQNGAVSSGSITLNNFQSTTVSCILVGAATYRWVVTNQY